MLNDRTKIAVLVSGGGTNLQALIDADLKAGQIVLVVSSQAGAYALTRAQNAGIPALAIERKAFQSQAAFEEKLVSTLEANGIELIILAGFLTILSEDFTGRYPNRILNIHPSLIPAFCGKGYYGLRVHEEALARGVKLTGATVHFVNEIPDGGEIIAQKAVAVEPGDTPKTLQRRVMEQAEWQLLPQAAELISERIRRSKMNVYEIPSIGSRLNGNRYPGRGIVIGKTADGTKAAVAYFIMGRSANSRNRIFTQKNGEVFTEPFDASKVQDPSLIIYAALRSIGSDLIVTNGNQTDTIYDYVAEGKTFSEALTTREFEPDGPNWTPRISGIAHFVPGDFTYEMSILKSGDAEGTFCNRFTYTYGAAAGLGHFIHTYVCDGNPVIPTFQGEPERVAIPDDIDAFTDEIWNNLDAENKISLYVRFIDLKTGESADRLVNKNV